MKKNSKKIPTSSWLRVGKILKSTTMIVGKEIAHNVSKKIGFSELKDKLNLQKEQAMEIVKTLNNLKGAALKAGQMMSLELSDLLPKEVVDILSGMHDSSSFMPFENVEKILVKNWGEQLYARVENISESPVAAASIGQVHTGIYDGQKIAIKIQYPKVDKSMESDVNTLKKLIKIFLRGSNKSIDLDDIFVEIKKNFKKEADYVQEANKLKIYKAQFQKYPDYSIPEVVANLSTKRVLTMEFIEGHRLSEFISPYDEEASKIIGDWIINLLFLEFFEFGLVQTDPNPGNFMVTSDPAKLVLLDLGSNKKYSKRFRKEIIQLLKIAMDGSDEEILEISTKYGLVDPRESEEVQSSYLLMMSQIVSMFKPENQPFNFADESYLKNIRAYSLAFARQVKFSKPAKELVFLNRKLGGMFHILKDAQTRLDLTPYWDAVQALEKTL